LLENQFPCLYDIVV
jgi:hypothetical protein